MEFRKVLALRGPNIWANFPVLEAWVDLQELKDSPSNILPGFNDRIMAWLPTMIEHRCGIGERGGFFQRLRTGTYQGHILEHVSLEIQSLIGIDVGFGRARETSEEGVYKVVIEYQDEEVGRAVLETGRRMLDAAVKDLPFDVEAELAALRELHQRVCLGPSTNAIVQAAVKRGIPVRRLNSESLVQLGYGARQRRILAAQTDRTGAVAEAIAQDKQLTRSLLRAMGVPVPNGRPVSDPDDAWQAAQEIGAAVVVKPQYGSQGRGVATNLTTREQVVAAFHAARETTRWVLVERFAPGADYRLLVVGDRVVAAARREPAQVVGDGVSSIRALVDQVNRDPRRGDDHATVLSKIKLDSVGLGVLGEQGYTPDSVPPAGQTVLVRRNANLSTGGTAADVTDLVHPEVAARAVEAAKMVGLDVAGVDVVAVDISKPLESQGGIVVEVNASPGLRMHIEPSSGQPRPVGEAIIDSMFAEDQNGRIPVVAVTGVNGKTTTTRFIAHLLRTSGRKVGMTCTDGVYIDGRRVDGGDCSGPVSAQSVLANPLVEAAVLETARGGILRAGLGFDLCDVAVVTNIGEGDHLGLADIETLEKLAKVKRCIVDVVPPTGFAVLKADDPHVSAMAEYCHGSVIFFAQRGDDLTIAKHRRSGGRAIFVEHDTIVLAEGSNAIPLISLSDVPLTHGGRIGFQVENALAAAATAWALNMPLEVIRNGLETFAGDMEKVPGRFNLLDVNGATVIVDYGHNVSALQAMIEAIEQFPHQRRTAVYTAAGDRRDVDMIRQGELLADSFDRVVLYEDHYVRGREKGEIMGMLRRGMATGDRVTEIQEIFGAIKAVENALRTVSPGELLLVQADEIDETVNFIRQYLAANQSGREIDMMRALEVPATPVAAPSAAVYAAPVVD